MVVGLAVFALPVLAVWSTEGEATGARPQPGDANALDRLVPDINQLGESLYTTYLFAFEATSVLLVIAVVGAVVMAQKGEACRSRGRSIGRGCCRAAGVGGRRPSRWTR